jgi:phosphatidylglycerol:prolipoprotein diacylglycerol transferase
MLSVTRLSFPGLGIGEFSVKSEAFSIGNFSIAWYGLIICLGMIFAVGYVMFRTSKIGIDSDQIIDFALFVIPIGVIGARLYYVLMELDSFNSLGDVLNIRGGGLAIYGGIIAGAITVFVMCYVKKIYFPAFADCVVPGLIMAQAIGRWGNFMNGEAFGSITNSFLRMGIQNYNSMVTFNTSEMVYVHPTFLYESLWNLIGFIGVNVFYKHKKYDGQIFLMIFGWYGLGRMMIEGLRTDSLYLWGTGIRTSQALAAILFIVCTAFQIYFAFKRPTKPFFVAAPKGGADSLEVATEKAPEEANTVSDGVDIEEDVSVCDNQDSDSNVNDDTERI